MLASDQTDARDALLNSGSYWSPAGKSVSTIDISLQDDAPFDLHRVDLKVTNVAAVEILVFDEMGNPVGSPVCRHMY